MNQLRKTQNLTAADCCFILFMHRVLRKVRSCQERLLMKLARYLIVAAVFLGLSSIVSGSTAWATAPGGCGFVTNGYNNAFAGCEFDSGTFALQNVLRYSPSGQQYLSGPRVSVGQSSDVTVYSGVIQSTTSGMRVGCWRPNGSFSGYAYPINNNCPA